MFLSHVESNSLRNGGKSVVDRIMGPYAFIAMGTT
jgi:hypothetical protein